MHSRTRRASLLALGLALAGCGVGPMAHGPGVTATSFHASAVEGSREEKNGWIIVHVAGSPTDRGRQLGRLLAPEIRGVLKSISKGDDRYWRNQRDLATKLFASKVSPEYQAEMQGIADGADAVQTSALQGVDFKHVDYTDILALNSVVDLMFSDAPGRLLPAWGGDFIKHRLGWDGKHLPCSAFIATGAATADGKIVVGHSTWAPGIAFAKFYNVMVDIKPDQGHRLLMQALPGTISSNTDWYLNDAGIVLTETTLSSSGHFQDGDPIFQRSRKAVQYGGTVDEVITTLAAHNNGDYPNEWLVGDLKTNDIAMFELATAHQAAWRSSQKQWYEGQEGFYGGNNYAKDPGVRAELGGWEDGRGRIWANFYAKNKGHIDAAVGRAAMELRGINDYSMDGKVADSANLASLTSWAHWGRPATGGQWDALGAAAFIK
ncbi:MAG: Phospholipase [Cyanobacteria bacterium RYN_339]|nr:Phospholipase [Cyanobacteria bacterium RYN_339]